MFYIWVPNFLNTIAACGGEREGTGVLRAFSSSWGGELVQVLAAHSIEESVSPVSDNNAPPPQQ